MLHFPVFQLTIFNFLVVAFTFLDDLSIHLITFEWFSKVLKKLKNIKMADSIMALFSHCMMSLVDFSDRKHFRIP